jgi:hypothetical protein
MNCFRQIAVFTLITLLIGCASQSSKAIAKLDDKSPDFGTGACQNARHNAWVHDELKTHKMWAAPALVLLTGPVAVAPVLIASVGINTADHMKAADITTQCGGTPPTQEAMIGSIAVDTAVGLAIGAAVPMGSAVASSPR